MHLHQKKRVLSAVLTCLTACGCTLLILAAAYALRGIWPFGTDNIAYMDTAQFYVPGYYQLWDVLHGQVSPDLNWFSGLAESANARWTVWLYPYNWVFLLVARDHVLEGLSLYLAARLLFVALFASAVLCLRFPRTGSMWKVLLALLYTFSGYVLQYYSNFFWLDVVAVFPLLLYALERLLRDGKYILYTAVLAYFLYHSVYFSYMAVIYILLFSLAYILCVLPRDLRGNRAFRLGMSTAAAFGICAYKWLGSSSSIAGTSRFQSNLDSGLVEGMTTWNLPNTRHTFLMLLGLALAAALLFRAVRVQRLLPPELRRTRRRAIRLFLCMAAVFAVPMVFTNIDTAWHFGQYNFFPMRYGYMLIATLIAGAGLVLEEDACRTLPPAVNAPPRTGRLFWAAAGVAALGIVILLPRVEAIFTEYGACYLNALSDAAYYRFFAMLAVCGVLFTGLYYALFRLRDRKAAPLLLAMTVALQLWANACGLLAPDDDHTTTHEYDPAYIESADSLYSYISQQDVSPLSRFKNVDNSLNAGYPVIAGTSALSTMDSSNSATVLGVYRELGYTVNYCRVLDTGGTVFSDMLLGVDYILSARPLDETLYAPGLTVDGTQIGTALYPGVVGLMYDGGALDDYLELLTLPERLNALYGAFTDSQDVLAYDVTPELTVDGEGLLTYTLTCQLDGPAFLYMSLNGMMMNISAGGRDIAVPTYQNLDNTVYPAAFNSNLLYCGLFDGGPVEIQFSSAMDLSLEDMTVVALDKEALDSFYERANLDDAAVIDTSSNGMTITITADQAGRRLFLPISYSSRWHCTVNGQPTQIDAAMGVLLGIPLQEGTNTVTLIRVPARLTMSSSLVISIASILLCAAWLTLRRVRPEVRKAAPPRLLCTVSLWLFYAAAAAAICFIYVVPTVLLIARGTVVPI